MAIKFIPSSHFSIQEIELLTWYNAEIHIIVTHISGLSQDHLRLKPRRTRDSQLAR